MATLPADASMLTAAYPTLKTGLECRDLGANRCSRRDWAETIQCLVRASTVAARFHSPPQPSESDVIARSTVSGQGFLS